MSARILPCVLLATLLMAAPAWGQEGWSFQMQDAQTGQWSPDSRANPNESVIRARARIRCGAEAQRDGVPFLVYSAARIAGPGKQEIVPCAVLLAEESPTGA